MNRQERRKLQRQGIKVESEPTLNVKVSDYAGMYADAFAKAKEDAKKKATEAALHEIDQQILERDLAYSLDLDAMVLWSMHKYLGFGKKRLTRFFFQMVQEHVNMRKFYEMDDTYPEQMKLKDLGVDVVTLNKAFMEQCEQTEHRSECSETP